MVLQTSQVATANECTGEADTAYYCSADESINISWKNDLENYKDDPLAARVWMMDTMAHEYGHHVQQMTEMITASFSREGLGEDRRRRSSSGAAAGSCRRAASAPPSSARTRRRSA